MYQLFHLSVDRALSLQKQLREQVVSAIIDGHIPVDKPLPSSRKLSKQLKVARNTVILAYEHLLDDGYLVSKERSGYYVNPDVLNSGYYAKSDGPKGKAESSDDKEEKIDGPNWPSRFTATYTDYENITKPPDWQKYPYPFIYGQIDRDLFPINHWRECCLDAGAVRAIWEWTPDGFDVDDELLIEQIHTRLLPRRGVWASPDEILVTVGAQHALYMIVKLLLGAKSVMGIEDPGYVDIRNMVTLNPSVLKPLPIDEDGLIVDESLDECDCIYVTPSHQSPTTVTMPLERRYELLKKAKESDIILIEDDYESETNFRDNPVPALKSLDDNDRVIYVGSLSKTLAPGLRCGFMVGPAEFIKQARVLRRLMLRHPAKNNQRTIGFFLSRGFHDTLIRTLHNAFEERSRIVYESLDLYLPESSQMPAFGGSSYWVKGPEGLDARELSKLAAEKGILIEPGDLHFFSDDAPLNYFRLGFSSIPKERIEPGIKELAKLIHKLV